MKNIYIGSDNIFSPLGVSTERNFAQMCDLVPGVKLQDRPGMSAEPFYASLFNEEINFGHNNSAGYTKFENLLIASITGALEESGVNAADKKTILIISTTKGNISLLEQTPMDPALKKRISLNRSAGLVAAHFGFINRPVLISNACISGLLAMLTGMRMIQSGQYENAVIAGSDVISKFILSGFQSFQAISPEPCKPFDAARKGINLGEAAASMILTSNPSLSKGVRLVSGSVSNDANHISGPSRTGEELNQAIQKAMKDAGYSKNDIDLISAHGTATIYNDEMEARAITLAGLENVPVNSLKGYYGHTLGAAGLIESIASVQSLKKGLVLPTPGFSEMGVSKPLNVSSTLQKTKLKNCLKTASGFGGCNAALILSNE